MFKIDLNLKKNTIDGTISRIIYAFIFMLIFFFTNTAKSDYDVTVTVLSCVVTTTSCETLPDVYIVVSILSPQPGYGVTGIGATGTIKDVPVGGTPHQGYVFYAAHYNPHTIKWWVYDSDWGWDCLMNFGQAGLIPGQGSTTLPLSTGTAANIQLKVDQVPTQCGGNVTIADRVLPTTVGYLTPLTVPVRLHIDTTMSPYLFKYYEQFPPGFTYQWANPHPDSIKTVSDSRGLLYTEILWRFNNPSWKNFTLTYNVITPATLDLLKGSFCGYIVQNASLRYSLSGFNSVNIGNTVGLIPISTKIPETYSLNQNYPNPFNSKTRIKFGIPLSPLYESGFVTLKIFDILGREITVLVNEQLKPGMYEVDWDASNYTSGVYYYQLIAGDYTETRKMVLVK